MTPVFEVEPGTRRAAEVALSNPHDPFSTPAFIEAMQRLGWRPHIALLRDGERIVDVCIAHFRVALASRTLEVTSLPALQAPDEFWQGLLQWCGAFRVQSLAVNSYAAGGAVIPRGQGSTVERRAGYVMRLDHDASEPGWSSHRAMLSLAQEARVRTERGPETAAATHIRLARNTAQIEGGVLTTGPRTVTERVVRALLSTGAAELHLAVQGHEILATLLVLVAARGACIHSIGASTDGASRGAAHLLVANVAADLQARGAERLVLGDADESHAWLESLIAGFATETVELESGRFVFGSPLRRRLGTAVRLMRERPAALVPSFIGRIERYVAYVARPASVPPPYRRRGFSIQPLDAQRLAALAERTPHAIPHRDRARELGFSSAWGVFANGELAHISWLLEAGDERRMPVRIVKVRAGEAEIGPCSTFPAFRGQGLYPYVIRELCRVAAERGLVRVFMITGSRNISSRRGIEKAGFQRCARIYRLQLAFLGERALTLRGHRGWLLLLEGRDALLSMIRRVLR